jgi:glucose-6-phosphate 1-epimerase
MIEYHGLPAVALESADGARTIITLHGAHVVSWICGGREQLFVSERSAFAADRPIRGGIPVVFPQFSGRGPLPHHGFARTMAWHLAAHDGASAVLALEDSDETRRLWPHAFALELAVTIGGARLDVELRVRNTGDAPFSFTAALHTYFQVSDAMKMRLEGLPGVHSLEKGLDRVYANSPRETRLIDGSRVVTIAQREFRDTVVWNPGREKCAARADMAPLDFMNMLCVEAAAEESAITLAAGVRWVGGQSLAVSRG